MKTSPRFLNRALALAGLLLAGCGGGYVGGGYVGGGYYGGGYYDDGGVWVDNTVVVGGGRGWYHGHDDHAYAHPSFHPGPSAHAARAPRAAPSHRP